MSGTWTGLAGPSLDGTRPVVRTVVRHRRGRSSPPRSRHPRGRDGAAMAGVAALRDESGSRCRGRVSRVLFRPWLPAAGGDHSSGPVIAGGLERPTRGHCTGRATPVWSCFGWGLPCLSRHRESGALLPHRFTLTRTSRAVCFLWHFPASYLDWPLASTLPCEARTFLSSPASRRPAITSIPAARAAATIPRAHEPQKRGNSHRARAERHVGLMQRAPGFHAPAMRRAPEANQAVAPSPEVFPSAASSLSVSRSS
jgi:hypothetical protein